VNRADLSNLTTAVGTQSFRPDRDRVKFYLALLFMLSLFGGMLGLGIVRKDLPPGILAMVLSFLSFYTLSGVAYLLTTAELLLDEEGLSRKLFGRVYGRIYWRDVQCIQETSNLVRKQTVTVIRIIPKPVPFWSFRLSGSISMGDQMDGFAELIEILNHYISVHLLRVEIRTDGVWQRRQQLSTSLEKAEDLSRGRIE
jgi:hypothetical protein